MIFSENRFTLFRIMLCLPEIWLMAALKSGFTLRLRPDLLLQIL
jgi:hypothetical protein